MAGSTANMGLRQWNLTTDFFESGNLSSNWTKIDTHDHTPGKGPLIPTGGIQNSAINSQKLAAGAVSLPKTGTGINGLAEGAFLAYRGGATFALPSGVEIPFDTELYDIGGHFDSASGRWTPPYAGLWRISAAIAITPTAGAIASGTWFRLAVTKNNNPTTDTNFAGAQQVGGTSSSPFLSGSIPVQANGTDFFSLKVFYVTATNISLATGVGNGHFAGEAIGLT